MAKKNKQAPAEKKVVAPVVDPVTPDQAAPQVDPVVDPVETVVEDHLGSIEVAAAALAPGVTHNPTHIVWPSDPYGITKDLKVTVTRLGSRIGGHTDKRDTAMATIAVGIAYLAAKFAEEKRIHDERFALAAEPVESTGVEAEAE